MAIPSAKVDEVSVSIGRPACHDRVIEGAASDWMPTIRQSGVADRSQAPTPTMSAPLPTGT